MWSLITGMPNVLCSPFFWGPMQSLGLKFSNNFMTNQLLWLEVWVGRRLVCYMYLDAWDIVPGIQFWWPIPIIHNHKLLNFCFLKEGRSILYGKQYFALFIWTSDVRTLNIFYCFFAISLGNSVKCIFGLHHGASNPYTQHNNLWLTDFS